MIINQYEDTRRFQAPMFQEDYQEEEARKDAECQAADDWLDIDAWDDD